MRFNLKLFVLVGIFVGLCDVWGVEENEDDGFIVSEELKNNEELKAAVNERRVIKAVYKARYTGRATIICKNFKDKLSKVLVYDWHFGQVQCVDGTSLVISGDFICYNMTEDLEYIVYFIFKGGGGLLDSTASMFKWCHGLIRADLRHLSTKNVIDMSGMFNHCIYLTELDLGSFNTTSVTDMNMMFYQCSALTDLDLSKFDTQNVTDMEAMFYGCRALTKLDLRSFNTLKVESMFLMFNECSALTELNLSNFDTTNVKNMSGMFKKCTALTKLNLSKFDTKNVTNMSRMFCGCKALTKLNLSKFDTKNVINMESMFFGCTDLKNLNLSNFDFHNVVTIDDMFTMCNFDNLCIPNTRERRWCCCGRYVYLTGKVAVNLNPNNWEFEVVHDDLVSNNTPSLL